jgi:hypothetical protein
MYLGTSVHINEQSRMLSVWRRCLVHTYFNNVLYTIFVFISDVPIFTDHVFHNHLAVCLTTGPKPLPKRVLNKVRSRDSFSRWQCPLLSLRSFSSFLRLLSRLPVTSIPPLIFPSITCCRRQFLHKMWPILLAFRLLISCFLTLSNTKKYFFVYHRIGSTDLLNPSPAPHF